MIKDISKIMTWHVWMVTYLRRNVTIVCSASCHLLGSQISWDSKIRFWLQVKSHISDWQFSKSRHLARYVSRHNATAYDTEGQPTLQRKCVYWTLFYEKEIPTQPWVEQDPYHIIFDFQSRADAWIRLFWHNLIMSFCFLALNKCYLA